jgi:3-hydroxyisobutyrate dehydrogenase
VAELRLGFVGLGAIGAPMAAHLAREGKLTVWNRTRARAQAFAARHTASVAERPRDAATGADVVVTCLPTSREVAAVLDGPDGLEAGLASGALLIDCTSGDAASSRRIAARLAGHGVAFVDAPVSGGTNGAEAGTLTVMVGGERQAFERARPILAAFASTIEHMGPVGTGHTMKAINQALLAVNIFSVGEALATLVRAGVPARAAVHVLNASSGRSFVSEALVPERVLTGRWPRTFRLALLDKDAAIARDVLQETGVQGPIIELAAELCHRARTRLGEDADYLEAIKLIETAAGVKIRSDGQTARRADGPLSP